MTLKTGGPMLIRLPQWGFALLIAGSLWPISGLQAQDASDAEVKKPAVGDRADEIEERSIQRRNREPRPHKIHDADPWKKHPPVWSIRDVSKDHHPYASPSAPALGGGHFPGGPTGRFGQPYYYTGTSPDTSGTGGGAGYGTGGQSLGGYGDMSGYPAMAGGLPNMGSFNVSPAYADPSYAGGYGAGSMGGYGGPNGSPYVGGNGANFAPPLAPALIGSPGIGGPSYGVGGPGYGPSGGGASYAAVPGQLPGDPYAYHFGPGYYRYQEAGHYRFPYYSYLRPWYFPGHPSYNRDTNIPW